MLHVSPNLTFYNKKTIKWLFCFRHFDVFYKKDDLVETPITWYKIIKPWNTVHLQGYKVKRVRNPGMPILYGIHPWLSWLIEWTSDNTLYYDTGGAK